MATTVTQEYVLHHGRLTSLLSLILIVSMWLYSLGVTSEKRGNTLFYKLLKPVNLAKQWTFLVCHTINVPACDTAFHCILCTILYQLQD